MTYNVLVVDDDASERRVVESILHDKIECHTFSAGNGEEAVNMLTSSRDDIDVVLLDMSMPGAMDGLAVINAVRPVKPNLPIIVRTGFDDISLAISAMKAGATDFVKKLDGPEKLRSSITNALRAQTLDEELTRMRRNSGHVFFDDLIGQSTAFRESLSLAKRVSSSHVPVFLEGESGVGKEVLARAIHNASARASKPFVVVNCGALPKGMEETVLFGVHSPVEHSSVFAQKAFGKFREAEGGTLFLDEVHTLPLHVQDKLLHTLQEGEIEPIGADAPVRVDVRVMSSAHQPLVQEMQRGHIGEAFYYRLNVFPIHVAPLRDRREDIPLLVTHYLARFASLEGKRISGVADDALRMLTEFAWPGNVRQLKNAVFRAVVMCEGSELTLNHFASLQNDHSMSNVRIHPASSASVAAAHTAAAHLNLVNEEGNIRSFVDLEKEIIVGAIRFYSGHMSKVARHLKIGRSTLYRKMGEMNIPLKYGHH